LIQEIAVTAELTGTSMSEAAAEVMATELAAYDRAQISGALRRCRHELRGRLSMAEVLLRLDDGRPGPEEAWTMIPLTEDQTVVWTDEMREAFRVCADQIRDRDKIAARMAFKEVYLRLVQAARESHLPPNWVVSIGQARSGRAAPLQAAVEARRISMAVAAAIAPELLERVDAFMLGLDSAGGSQPALPDIPRRRADPERA
jgi:hypothetical protein